MNIRILSSASPDDYHLAVELTGFISNKYNSLIYPEDSEGIIHQEFLQKYDKEWCIIHSYQVIDMLFSMIASEQSTLKISTINSEYEAGPRVLKQIENFDKMHEEFIRRIIFFNYAENYEVFIPSLLVLHNDGKSKKVKLATLGEGVDSLISTKANVIGLSSDNDEKVIIATDQLLNLMENEIVWISENFFYVEGISGLKWKNLLRQAENYHLENLFSVGTEITEEDKKAGNEDGLISSFRGHFTEEEWKKLSYSPYLSFLLVSLADETMDKKELNAFVKSLSKQENPLMIEILESINRPHNEIISDLMALGENAPILMQEIGEMLDSNLPPKYAMDFKFELIKIGKEVANASGGFFGFGNKISKEEKMALVIIAKMLQIS